MSSGEHQPQQPDYCPKCGVAYEPLQEYCLECGARLPTNQGVVGVLASRWQRRFAWYPGDWIWPVLLFLVLTVVATALAVAAGAARDAQTPTLVATDDTVTVGPGAPVGSLPVTTGPATLPNAPAPTITTGPLPTAPGSRPTTTAPIPKPNPNALTTWPTGKSGYTTVLESLPVAAGRDAAVARARQAKRNGLKDVGVLVSSQFSSLHPGYYVVFSGVYASGSAAAASLSTAHARGFPDAYQTRVTR
jgi:hypothetical protein